MFSHTHKDEIGVIFDIGNGSVGGALVKFNAHQEPIVIYTHREPLTFVAHTSSDHLLESMLKLLQIVTQDIIKNGLPTIPKKLFTIHPIQHAFCFFSSPWFVSQTKIIKVERPKEFIVKRSLLNNIIDREEMQFVEELREGKYEEIFGKNVELLEKKVINVKLNGYDVEAIYNQRVRELDITFFTSIISSHIKSKVEHIIYSALHPAIISSYSFMLTAWSAIREAFPSQTDFIFADITGEVTDISITVAGIFMETVSFPLGRSNFLRHIVDSLNVPPEVALSYLTMSQEKKIEPEFEKKLNAVVAEFRALWLEKFIATLKQLESRYMMPKVFFTTIDSDLAPYFIEEISKPLPLELNISDNTFTIIPLTADKLHLFNNRLPKKLRDPFLMLETVFTNKHSEQYTLRD